MKFKEIFQDEQVHIMTNIKSNNNKYLELFNVTILKEDNEFLCVKIDSGKEIYLNRQNIVIINKM